MVLSLPQECIVYRRNFLAAVGGGVLAMSLPQLVRAQAAAAPFIRWADLEVDPTQLEAFNAAASAHVEAVLRSEPGVIAFHAASEADTPHRFRVFEMYADDSAYRAHLQQPHFRAFVDATAKMMTGRQLYDMVPVRLGAKSRLAASPLVRIAEIEIDPAQLQAYEAAVSEEIDDSMRLEPGVLTIYSVARTDKRNHLRFFEIYADDSAYRQHIESPHFKKYVETTRSMITSRKLFETRHAILGLKQR
jgi:quinol monooxygenase YgiN